MTFKDGAAGGFGDSQNEADNEEVEQKPDPDVDGKNDDGDGSGLSKQVTSTDTTSPSGSRSSSSLPWIYAREGITDGREKTVQLHLQQHTLDTEHEAKTILETRLSDTVNKADIREAAYLVGLSDLDAVADKLREWGYDVD